MNETRHKLSGAATRRDRAAWWLANWSFQHIATSWYRDRIDGYLRYGMFAAARDFAVEKETLHDRGSDPGQPAPGAGGVALQSEPETVPDPPEQ